MADSLSRYFGDKRVFRDIDGIGGGADFSEVIHGTLGKADAAVILVEESRRPYFLAAAWVGTIGTLTFFILLLPICEPYEPISMFFGGTVTAVLMFALMNLSGFRPK